MAIQKSQSWAATYRFNICRLPISIAPTKHRRLGSLVIMTLLFAMKRCSPQMAATAFQPHRHPRATRRTFGTPSGRAASVHEPTATEEPPLLLSEGLFAVVKPLDWTSNDVVSYLRRILERDARERGARPEKVGSRKNKSKIVRVGHGGTLDPLATGVLVIGVGKGTKQLQTYLEGPKGYRAGGELGFETTTLDMEGNVTKTAPFDHVSRATLDDVIPNFVGHIQQIPPIFSAIRKDGKQLYKEARAGKSVHDIEIEPREVHILSLEVTGFELPKFDIQVYCGGGTYIRSLIRDISYQLGSVGTTTFLERTQQGQFKLDDPGILAKDDWTPEKIYAAIDAINAARKFANDEGNEL